MSEHERPTPTTESLRWRRVSLPWRRVLRWALGLTLTVAALVGGANALVVLSAGPHLFESPDAITPREAVIVPGAKVWPDGTPSPALQDRLACALDLHRSGKARTILVSGDHGAAEYDEPNAMRAWLVERGVPSAAVFMDHAGFRTLDTMHRAARVFEVRRAVVCSQAFHLARAVYLARDAGIDAVGLVADRLGDPNAAWNFARETLARVRAVLDADLWGTEPALLGPEHPISGPSSATHDRWTEVAVQGSARQ